LTAQGLVQYRHMAARIISNTTNRERNFITLNKGTMHGVIPNVGVITPDGVMVGFVAACSNRYSVVKSILNTDFRSSGKIVGDDRIGSISWSGKSPYRVEMNNLSIYAEIEVGDVITYVLPNDMPSTHRVIGVDAANQHFYTKGDANDIADGSPVHFKNLIGTPVFKIPLLGYVAYYIQHPPGMYIAIAVGAILLILVFLPDLFKKDGKKEAAVATSAASAVATTEKAEDAKASEATSSETDGNQTQG
jgi:hypothetical protein